MEFTLREWKKSDSAALQKYADNIKIANNLRDVFPNPYTLSDAENYIRSCLEESPARQYVRAVDIGGEAAGSIGVFLRDDVYRKSGEIGYWLGEPFWKQGIMSEAVRRVCGHVFAHYDIVRIDACVFAGNAASRKVLEKAGFTLEGVLRKSIHKNGEYQDGCMYSKII